MTTIFALSTPPGRAAIAVVRLSGPAVGTVLDSIAPPCPEPRRAVVRKLRDPRTDTLLDEALVLYFAAPKSETGEDMAELQLHGLAAFGKCAPFARRQMAEQAVSVARANRIRAR